jgi:hypothetical protein
MTYGTIIIGVLRVVLTLIEKALAGQSDAAEAVLSLLPEGELKTTTTRKFAEAAAEAKFGGVVP